jgi:multisubunit Na+/H+ antiporter MnhC subunit
MLQSVSLGLILTGWQRGDIYAAQSMVISALVIEAVVIGLALTMIIQLTKHVVEKRKESYQTDPDQRPPAERVEQEVGR